MKNSKELTTKTDLLNTKLDLSFDKRDLIDVIVNQQVENFKFEMEEEVKSLNSQIRSVKKEIYDYITKHPDIKPFMKKGSELNFRFYIFSENDTFKFEEIYFRINNNEEVISVDAKSIYYERVKLIKEKVYIGGDIDLEKSDASNSIIEEFYTQIIFKAPMTDKLFSLIESCRKDFHLFEKKYLSGGDIIKLNTLRRNMKLEISKNLIKQSSPELAKYLKENFGI